MALKLFYVYNIKPQVLNGGDKVSTWVAKPEGHAEGQSTS